MIHRDLKPSNVKITPAHVVKVLDFGLAKSVAMTGAADDLTQAPGRADDASGSPLVMGTTAYMSPEQVQGHTADKRTDVWAFGVVFFEMVTGRRPFRGQTATETLASILKTEPDWGDLPPAVASRRTDGCSTAAFKRTPAPAAVDRRRARSDRDPDPRWRR